MKNYLILLFVAVNLSSCKSNRDGVIEFKHVGESDKYIQTLLIVKKEQPSTIQQLCF